MSRKSGVVAQTNRWRRIGSRRYRKMVKLDGAKAAWIIREREKGTPYREIAETMWISVVWVKKLCAGHGTARMDWYATNLGRPEAWLYGRREYSAVLHAHNVKGHAACLLELDMPELAGLHISHNTILRIARLGHLL